MKIGIIAFNDRNIVPYVENYISIFEKKNIEYECVFWDRYSNAKTNKKDNIYTLHIKCEPGCKKFFKIIPMLKFKFAVEELIKIEKYTHLVILGTQPAILLHRTLTEKFKERYIFDFRDYTYEKFNFYKRIVHLLIDNSKFTSISSKGFLRFLLPSKKIILSHNIIYSNSYDVSIRNGILDTSKDILNIGFVGGIRYFEVNKTLICKLKNSKNFRLLYVGKPNIDCDLNTFCLEHKVKNVVFKGEFKNFDKYKIYEEIDFINSLYGNENLEVTTALPNRLYDSLIYKKPIIASKGTYLGELVESYNIGLVLNVFEDDIETRIIEYINNLDVDLLETNMKKLLTIVIKEQDEYLEMIEKFCSEIED